MLGNRRGFAASSQPGLRASHERWATDGKMGELLLLLQSRWHHLADVARHISLL